MNDRLLLTPESAATELSISRTVLYELLSKGHIESIRVGRSRRILRSSLESFIARLGSEQGSAWVGTNTHGS